MGMNDSLFDTIDSAVKAGDLLASSAENIDLLLGGTTSPVAAAAIAELVEKREWSELNDRFFKTLAFGTGGLRGRTIGRVVTDAEAGEIQAQERPEHPCVGTATMNYFNISRAVRGLVSYVQKDLEARGETRKARLVLGHDTRHFSREFAEFCAKVATDLGCDAYLFEGPRATPQVSFAIRELRADAGIVLTASHNPSHDNGFKAYFNDGAQLIAPHDQGVIDEVNSLDSEAYEALPEDQQGSLTVLGEEADESYLKKLRTLLMKPELLEGGGAKVVYTNLHGTGGHLIVPTLREFGFEVLTVPEQDVQDGRFPTVASPNPENAPALKMAMDLATESGAEIVIGTDPDCDRMGVAVRNDAGEMQLLTGNQIGSLLAWYRIKAHFDLGWLNDSNRGRALLIATYVTTELQQRIAEGFGIQALETLTGFKYIAEKLGKYEAAIPADKKGDYRELTETQSRELRLEYSRYFVVGGEESYGYLACDFVRDKDGNAAAVLFAELAAYAKCVGKSIPTLLDDLYQEYGVHLEQGHSIVMEGADGAAKIKALAASYSDSPPTELDGSKVSQVIDFSKDRIFDAEGDPVPAQAMIQVVLEDGRKFAVRPSGTEPKIKYYLFGKGAPQPADVQTAKAEVDASLNDFWKAIQADAQVRMGA